MNRCLKLLGTIAVFLAAPIALHGAATYAPGETYAGIALRNAFHLQPFAPHEVSQPKPSSPRLTLVGITTILGIKQAFLKVQPDGPSHTPAQEQFLTLAEGERAGEIKVLAIDEQRGTVRVTRFGTEVALEFETAG